MSKKTFKGKLDYVRQDDEDDALPNKVDADRIGGLMAPKIYEGTRRLAAAREIPIDRIRPDSNQPRTSYRKEGIEELAETIRQIGIINPIQVRYAESDDLFEIISGERRFRAAPKAQFKAIPCIVREPDDDERRAHQIIENVHREDLNAIDRARALLELKQTLGPKTKWKKVEEITAIHERRRQQFLNLLDLPEHMQEAILYRKATAWGGAITEKHARALVLLKHDTEEQEKLFQKILSSDTPYSGDRALSKARNIKNRVEPHLNLTFRYRSPQDLIRQLKEKLKGLTGE